MKRNINLFLSGVLLSFALTAQGQRLVSLDSVLSVIRERNPMLKSYKSRSDAMNTYAQGAGSWMAPEAGGGVWMLPYRKTDDPRNRGQFMLSVQQRITNPSKLRANRDYLQSKAAIEEAGEEYVYNELRAQAKTAYYQWVVLLKREKVLQESEKIVQLMLQTAQSRYPYNQGKLGNIYKAEARLQEIRNMQLMNETQVIQKNILINQLMNVPGESRFSIDTTNLIARFTPDPSDTSTLAQSRSDIRRIDQSIRSLQLNQKLEGYQSRPDLTLSFNHMISRSAGMPNQFMLYGMVSIPIAPWSARMYQSNVRGMGQEVEAMKSERSAILNEVQGMTAGMMAEITTLERQIENYEKRIVPALRKNYETLMLAYEQGQEELPMVIDAWETLNMTRLQQLDAVQKFYENVAAYEKQIEK